MRLTAHCLLRNEEIFIGPAVSVLAAELEHVIVMDTGSTDDTVDVLHSIGKKLGPLHFFQDRWGGMGFVEDDDGNDALVDFSYPVRVSEYGSLTIVEVDEPLTREQNGDARNYMTSLTRTDWILICDGDEYYLPEALRELGAIEMPPEARLGYLQFQVVRHEEGKWRYSEPWNGQALMYAPGLVYEGRYPEECPNWNAMILANPRIQVNIELENEPIWDFHHAIRSRKDDETFHRALHPHGRRMKMPLYQEVELPFKWRDEWWSPYKEE